MRRMPTNDNIHRPPKPDAEPTPTPKNSFSPYILEVLDSEYAVEPVTTAGVVSAT